MSSDPDDEDAITLSGCDAETYRLPQAYTKVDNAVQASSWLTLLIRRVRQPTMRCSTFSDDQLCQLES